MADERKPAGEQAAPDYGAVLVSWEFSEHEQHARGLRWYLWSSLFVIAVLVFSYFDQNPWLPIIIFLAVISFVIGEYRGPETKMFAITEDGILTGTTFYPYSQIRNFYIIFQPPHVKTLYFDPKSMMRPAVAIQLTDQNPNEIRQLLLRSLPEDLDKEDEPVSDFLGRIFKL